MVNRNNLHHELLLTARQKTKLIKGIQKQYVN